MASAERTQVVRARLYELVLSLVQNALPSTLLKCLYIFPELPPISSAPAISTASPTRSAASAAVPARTEAEAETERRLLVHKLFSQVPRFSLSPALHPPLSTAHKLYFRVRFRVPVRHCLCCPALFVA